MKKSLIIIITLISFLIYQIPNLLEIVGYLYNIIISIFVENEYISKTIMSIILIYSLLKASFGRQKILSYNYGKELGARYYQDDIKRESIISMILALLTTLYIFIQNNFIIIYVYTYFIITFIIFDYSEIIQYKNRKTTMCKRNRKKGRDNNETNN